MNRYRKEALQIQLPPVASMLAFKIKVKAKKKAAAIPRSIGFISVTSFINYSSRVPLKKMKVNGKWEKLYKINVSLAKLVFSFKGRKFFQQKAGSAICRVR
jgi:hypothetical protein